MPTQVSLSRPLAPQGPSPPTKLNEAASSSWVRRLAQIVNSMLGGQLNVTLPITLAASAPDTTITDARISVTSGLYWTPLTAHAAAELPVLYVSSQTNGSAVLTHANVNITDRNYTLLIIG